MLYTYTYILHNKHHNTPSTHLYGALGHIQDGDVQRAPAEVIHQDVVDVGALVQPVRHGRRGRLLHHAHHLDAQSQ